MDFCCYCCSRCHHLPFRSPLISQPLFSPYDSGRKPIIWQHFLFFSSCFCSKSKLTLKAQNKFRWSEGSPEVDISPCDLDPHFFSFALFTVHALYSHQEGACLNCRLGHRIERHIGGSEEGHSLFTNFSPTGWLTGSSNGWRGAHPCSLAFFMQHTEKGGRERAEKWRSGIDRRERRSGRQRREGRQAELGMQNQRKGCKFKIDLTFEARLETASTARPGLHLLLLPYKNYKKRDKHEK